MLLVAVGSVLFTLPHFLSPAYSPETPGPAPLCANIPPGGRCEETEVSGSNYYPLLLLGRVLHGMGCTPVYTLGVTYMDDILDRKKFATIGGT